MSDISHYDAAAWFLFRTDAIKVAGGCCERCSRPAGNGIILQVHHKEYIRGHKPWEYEHSDCEVLCKGCHAKEHGKIQPTSDWILVGEDDLEEVCGICDNCGTEIRYVFFIEHPKWNSMVVGTDCCDYLTESEEATKWRRLIEKKKRFINSKSWNFVPKQGNCITKSGILIQVQSIDSKFRIVADGFQGTKRFISEIEAKTTVFDLLHSNKIQNFLKDRRANRYRH